MAPIARLLSVIALLLAQAAVAGASAAQTPADGPWRLRLELSSFFDGHIGTLEQVIELRDGRWEGDIRQRQIYVGLRLAIAGGAVDGHMAVTAGSGWNSVSIPFDAVAVEGRVRRELVGVATYNAVGLGHRERVARDLYIDFSLERL